MDRRRWLWRRRSASEKSPGETESCGSVSSFSERCSDDQEVSRASPYNPVQSLEVASNVASCEDGDTMKSLTEKLACALLNIRAKEDLVSQHAKVAEEAVSGWETAEKEVISLRRQLETATQKNSTLEQRTSQLDEALKECVRQLQHTRQHQEHKLQDVLAKNTQEWESEKFEYESRLVKLEAMEKENGILRSELLARSEELDMRTLERDLSNRAAEAASKQHLESTKKATMLEAECRMLHAMVRRSTPPGFVHKTPAANSVLVSCSHGDGPAAASGERSLQSNNRPCCSNVEIDLMDDFLEMEKLVAMPETSSGGPLLDSRLDHSTDDDDTRSSSPETFRFRPKLPSMAEMEKLLSETQDRLRSTCEQLREAETKLADLQRQLRIAHDSKLAAEIASGDAEVQRKLLESQLESADRRAEEQHGEIALLEARIEEERALSAELASKCRDLEDQLSETKREAEAQRQLLQTQLQELDHKIALLEEEATEERVLSAELATKCKNLEDELSERKREAEIRRAAISNGEFKIKQEKELAVAAKKFAECQDTIASISQQLKSLATLDELVDEGGVVDTNGSSPQISRSGSSSGLCHQDQLPPPPTTSRICRISLSR